jgi:hypothetical protein
MIQSIMTLKQNETKHHDNSQHNDFQHYKTQHSTHQNNKNMTLSIMSTNVTTLKLSGVMLSDIIHNVVMLSAVAPLCGQFVIFSETARFKKCKQLFEYQHLLLLRDIWWSKFYSIIGDDISTKSSNVKININSFNISFKFN